MTADRPLPIANEAWPAAIAHLRDGPLGRLNVYRTMAHNPPLLAAWAALRDHLVVHSALSPRQSELVILRTGWHWRSRYEWMHHVSRGRRVGLDEAAIARCAAKADAGDDGDRGGGDAILLPAVDALLARGRLDAPLRARVEALVGVAGLLDVIATIGMYTTLALLLETFAVPLDADIAEELAGDPLAALAPEARA